MTHQPVFGRPETGGVVFDPPAEKEPQAKRRVRVRGFVTVRAYVFEEFDTHEDNEDAIINEALNKADISDTSNERLTIEELDGPRIDALTKLEAWQKGEPIRVQETH